MSTLELQLEFMRQYSQQRMGKRMPERMVFVFGRGGIGTIAVQNVVAASFVRRYPRSPALALLRDGDSGGLLFDWNPYLRYELRMDGNVTGLVDWFDIGAMAPVTCPDPNWVERRFRDADAVFLPHMLSVPPARLAGFAEAMPHLRVPPSQEPELWQALAARGLDQGGWFAALQVKEQGDPDRRANAESYLPAVRTILERGGRVVRLGPPGGRPLPGAIDLRGAELPLQLAAIAASRFVLGGDCAAVSLASAFGVPCGLTNAVEYRHRVWAPEAIVLAKTIELSNGSRLDTPTAFARGFLDGVGDAPVAARHDNRPEDLAAVAAALYEATADCPGWRAGREPSLGPELPHGVAFPQQLTAQPPMKFWSS